MPIESESFDLICLRALKIDADSERVALCAASIVVHAYAAGRVAPEAQPHVLRIVDLARRFYADMPTRHTIVSIVDDSLDRLERAGSTGRNAIRDRLVQNLMDYFYRGEGSLSR